MHPLSLTSSKTPPRRPFPELAPHTGLNSGLLAPEFNLRLSTVGVLPSPSVPQFPQWPTKDNLPPPPPGLSACHSEREGAGQTKLSLGPSTPHVAPPEASVSIHPRTGNVHTFPIQCQPYRGLPWSMSSGGQWVGAWEVPTDPRAHATSSPLGLSAPTPRVSQRAFPRDSTREGLPWQWLLGMQWGGRLCEYPCAFCRTHDPPAPGGPWGPVPTWRGRSSATPGAPTAVTVLPHGHQRDRPAL